MLKFTKQQVIAVRRSITAKLHEHLREFFLRQMLLFWWFFGTFAGIFPVFVAVLVVLWNICRKIVGRLSLFLSVVLGW